MIATAWATIFPSPDDTSAARTPRSAPYTIAETMKKRVPWARRRKSPPIRRRGGQAQPQRVLRLQEHAVTRLPVAVGSTYSSALDEISALSASRGAERETLDEGRGQVEVDEL